MDGIYKSGNANVEALVDAGVRIAFGTDRAAALEVAGVARREIQALKEIGLSPGTILRSLTHDAAFFLGREKELGTVEPGKRADFVVLEANPLDDLAALEKIVMVIKDGQIVVDRR